MTIGTRHMKVIASAMLSNQMQALQPDLGIIQGILETHGVSNASIEDLRGIMFEFSRMKKSRARKLMDLSHKWLKERAIRRKRLKKKEKKA